MSDPDLTPVIVAVGQAESRDHELGPVELLERASREAVDSAPGLGAAIERVTVVGILTRRAGPAPASDLAKSLGLRHPTTETTPIGGNTPQLMVERAAADIAAGRLGATLIAGVEAVRAGRLQAGAHTEASEARAAGAPRAGAEAPRAGARAAGGGARAAESWAETEPDPVVGTDRQDLSDEERAAGIFIPLYCYPLFESVLATRAGRDPLEQRRWIGELLAPFTEVASRQPHAWFGQVRTPAEISEPSPDNRLVVEPYTKQMVAFLGGAQSAALVMTSLAVARRFGLDDGAMFPWSAASACDVWYPVDRPDLGRAAGLELAASAAFSAAGVGIDDIALLDVYSCFPSAVQIGAAAIGAGHRLDDPASLTLTGGLPYFGGPGNNYTTHAIAALFERLRQTPKGTLGVTTGVGWYLTKHAIGVYGSEGRGGGFRRGEVAEGQAELDATALQHVPAGTVLDGLPATVEASTVIYDRDGAPSAAPVIATLADGRRVAAAAEASELHALAHEAAWLVGATVTVSATPEGQPRYHVDNLG